MGEKFLLKSMGIKLLSARAPLKSMSLAFNPKNIYFKVNLIDFETVDFQAELGRVTFCIIL